MTAVIGSYNAATTDPASYVYNRAGVIHLMPSCAQPLAMDKGFHQTFRLCFREERTSQATADFVTEVLDAQRLPSCTTAARMRQSWRNESSRTWQAWVHRS